MSVSWLKTVGFTSSNDKSIIGVLKFIGFIDQSGVPTSTWSAFRGARHKAILGGAIRKGYAELYAIYPDAHLRTNIDLTHVFSTSSSAGSQVIGKTVATFKALADEAEFDTSTAAAETFMPSGPLHTAPASAVQQTPQSLQIQAGPALHIDIQIHISPDSTSEQIEKILASMAKHLYGRKDE